MNLLQENYGNFLHPKLKLFLDSPSNEFNTQYPSWPFRVWIIDQKKAISFKGMANADTGYNINLREVRHWINRYVHLTNRNRNPNPILSNETALAIVAQEMISEDMNPNTVSNSNNVSDGNNDNNGNNGGNDDNHADNNDDENKEKSRIVMTIASEPVVQSTESNE